MLLSRARIARSFGELQLAILALADVMKRLQRRGRRAEDNRDLFAMGAPYRQVASVITPAFLLFIGAIVFFVDDNNAEVFKRCKQRRAGADNDRRFAIFRF